MEEKLYYLIEQESRFNQNRKVRDMQNPDGTASLIKTPISVRNNREIGGCASFAYMGRFEKKVLCRLTVLMDIWNHTGLTITLLRAEGVQRCVELKLLRI